MVVRTVEWNGRVIARGRSSFDPGWADAVNDDGQSDIAERRYACPCCGYLTLPVRGDYELCDVCFWEDGGHDGDDDPDGPNHISLNQGRVNFVAFGACDRADLDQVRPPLPEERSRRDVIQVTNGRRPSCARV